MGLFDKLKGVQGPDDGVAAVPPAELAARLLALNGPDRPYEIWNDDSGNIVGTWRVADQRWRQIVGQAGLVETYRLTLRPHQDEVAVHACEQSFEASWSSGSGQIKIGGRRERNGITVRAHGSVQVPGNEPFEFDFDADQLRDPIRDTVTASGWTWRPVRGLGGL